jgi:hypothetical protein
MGWKLMSVFLLATAPALAGTGTGGGKGLGQDSLTLVRGGRSSYRIVLSAAASPSERHAAAELHRFVMEMSGAELPLCREGDAEADAPAILVGRSPQAEQRLGPGIDWDALGAEGFILRTIPPATAGRRSAPALIIAGGRLRGTMYGVYELLDRLGCRWFTPKVSRIPRRRTIAIPPLDVRGKPDFEYREPFFTEAFDADWAARNRVNSANAALDEVRGGKVTYHHFVHTFDDLVPRELFAEHPEYFPLIKAKRTNGYVQRCLTNPEVLKLAIERVRAWMRERPDAMIYSVSQNDTGNWCECDHCRAVTEEEGAHSGLYLRFVNAVAETIEREHPDKLIDTLAYQFTEAPPRRVRPRRNVRVRLCPIACCEAHPYEECSAPANVAYVQNLKAWAKITNTLYIWHYNTNFAHYLLPFPDFRELAADTAMYRRLGVRGIFFQGAYAPGGGGSDAALRSYVLARLAWNVNDDWDARVTEWMRGVYGRAWRPMRAYFDLLHAEARNPERHFTIYSPPDVGYLTPAVLARADRLFDQAERLAKGDATAAEYVAKARLSVRYAHLMLRGQAAKAGDAAARTGLAEELRRFMADVRRFGITQLREGQELSAWEKARAAEWGLAS